MTTLTQNPQIIEQIYEVDEQDRILGVRPRSEFYSGKYRQNWMVGSRA